jgi:hypothetical protein
LERFLWISYLFNEKIRFIAAKEAGKITKDQELLPGLLIYFLPDNF